MIRFIQFSPEEHYPILKSWWEGHKWPIVPLASLPVKTGLVCYHEDTPVCSGFIYKTDTNICWMEWVLCDPKADREYRSDCIDSLINELSKLGKEAGYSLIFTSARHAGLMLRLEKDGFQVSDTEMTNMIKVL